MQEGRPPSAGGALGKSALAAAVSLFCRLTSLCCFAMSGWIDGRAGLARIFADNPSDLMARLGSRHMDRDRGTDRCDIVEKGHRAGTETDGICLQGLIVKRKEFNSGRVFQCLVESFLC